MKFFEKLMIKELRTTARIVLLFFAGVSVLVFLIHGLMVVGFKYPLDYGEGPLLNQSLRITQGEPLYPNNLSESPFVITNYPPIYVLVNALFVLIFGPSLLYGRLISLFSTIGAAILLGLIVHNFSGKRDLLPALVTGGLFLAVPYVVSWSALFRIDMLALLFSLLGLYHILNHADENKGILMGALLFVCAAFTRQTFGFATPLAALAYLWFNYRKQAGKFIIAYAGIGLVLFALLTLITKGGFFFHIITANVNPFKWEVVWNYALQILYQMPLLLLIWIVYAGFGWRAKQKNSLVFPYVFASALVAITIGKVGSNVNYLLELSAALSLLTGIAFQKGWKFFPIRNMEHPDMNFPKEEIPEDEEVLPEIRRKLWLNLIIALIMSFTMIYQIASLIHTSLISQVSPHRDRMKPVNDYVFLEENIKRNSDKGPILADEYMALLPMNNIPLYLQPFEFVQLSQADLWDQTPLLSAIQNQTFPMILIHHFKSYPVFLERWTPETLDAIFHYYIATDMRAETLIFNPKAFASTDYPLENQCPESPWQTPTRADLGMLWQNGQLLLLGAHPEGKEPVFAVADGLLFQFEGWSTAVAIQHENPLNPGKYLWSFYGDLAPAFNHADNYFTITPTAEGIPVKAGDLIGYQGRWWGPDQQTWVHLRFTILPAGADGQFPESLLPIVDPLANLPSFAELQRAGLDAPISITAYTGLPESDMFGVTDFLPYQCESKKVNP